VSGIDVHDVPENRLSTYLDHRLRAQSGFLGQSRSKPPGQDNGFHGDASSVIIAATSE
jgi:hypothetical protein